MQSKSFRIKFDRGEDGNIDITLPWKVNETLTIHTDQVYYQFLPEKGLTVNGYFKLYEGNGIMLHFDIKECDRGNSTTRVITGHVVVRHLSDMKVTDNDLTLCFPKYRGMTLEEQIYTFNKEIHRSTWTHSVQQPPSGTQYLLNVIANPTEKIDLTRLYNLSDKEQRLTHQILQNYKVSPYRKHDLYTIEVLSEVCYGITVYLDRSDNRWLLNTSSSIEDKIQWL